MEFKFPNPAQEITAPKFQKHPVETFTKEDVEKILKACVYSRESQTEERKKFVMRRPSANRDQAIVLMLLDTGLRATELCSLIINDVDLKTGKVTIRHGVAGGEKKTVWRYLSCRTDLNINELYMLKHKYGLSMLAWIYRAKDLSIISENTSARLFHQLRVNDWQRLESGKPYPSETPMRMERLIYRALAEDLISSSRAQELSGKPLQLRFKMEVLQENDLTIRAGYEYLD